MALLSVPMCLSGFVALSMFIQIIGQISRLPRSTTSISISINLLRAKGCASPEMTMKWIPARKPPILPNLPTIYNLFMQNKANFRKSQVDVRPLVIMNYERKSDWTLGENEPKTNPIKPNLHLTAENTEYAEKKDIGVSDCSIDKYALYHISPRSLRTRRLMKNKAKTNPISKEPK